MLKGGAGWNDLVRESDIQGFAENKSIMKYLFVEWHKDTYCIEMNVGN